MDNYTILHLHTELSNGTTNIDSVTNYKDYIDKAKEFGMKSICFTEHGNVFSWLHKKEYAEKNGLKYIHGVEAYITEDPDERIRDNYHCVLIAKNHDGFLELNELVSKSFNRADVKVIDNITRFYYTPRITFDELLDTSDNIIVTSACLGGILNKGNNDIRDRFICFMMNNKHRCYLELQHHNDEHQKKYNQYLVMLHEETGIPLTIGTDTHALNDEHVSGRDLLQKAKGVLFEEESGFDLRMKSLSSLIEAYEKQNAVDMKYVYQGLENTNNIADQIEEFTVDRSYKYPHLWDNPLQLFRDKIKEGIIRRGVDKYPNYQEYLDKIEYEIEAYVHNGAVDFMLLMEDIISWCNKNDIQVGYGRGSVNGSVIAWLLGITEMDSIKHKLNFQRFMNVERVSLSDIDTDFPPSRIENVKQYIYNKHGLFCSDIITFNTIADKGAIRDVCRGLYKDFRPDYMKITNDVIAAFNLDPEKAREKYPDVFKYVDIVKGTVVSVGSHPCGLLVAPSTLTDNVGTFTTSTSSYPISQLNMKEVDSMNYVKLDLLRLDTIELINETCKLIGIDRLTPDNVDTNDPLVWKSIRDDTTQIFQWEGNTGDTYIKKLMSDDNIARLTKMFPNMEYGELMMMLLSIGNSAIRPAGASYRDDLANGIIRETGSKPIDEFLSSTFGYLVFQCQIIEFLHKYCGFTMGEADLVRRGFAKKTGTDKYIPIIKDGGYISDEKKHYIKGFISSMKEQYGIDEKKSEEDIVAFIQVIEDASSYLFSINHSQPYSYEGYVSGYLRTYYPLEFITAAMIINKDKEEKTKALTEYAKKIGVEVIVPKFRHSRANYFMDKNTNKIYKGISSIKYMNENVAEELFALKDNQYSSFIDLLYDVGKNTSLDSRQLDILIKINFFSEFGNINQLLSCVAVFNDWKGSGNALAGKKTFKKKDVDTLGIPLDRVAAYLDDKLKTGVSKTQYKVLDWIAIVKEICKDIHDETNKVDIIKYQVQHLGYVDFVDKSIPDRIIAISNLDTTNALKFKAICLNNGKVCEMRVSKKKSKRDKDILVDFNDVPFEDGDILYMSKCKRKPKMRKTDTGFEEIPGEYNWWICDYYKVNNI